MNISFFKSLPNWVLWKIEKRGGKNTKVPYSSNHALASSTDEKTWTTHENAFSKVKNYSGIGFVLPLNQTILGIDLDHCLDENLKIENKPFAELVEKANTYTEISPSKTGLHLFFHVPEKINLEAHRSKQCPGFEVYSSGRYFTVTENIFENKTEIRSISPEEAVNLLSIVNYPWKKKEEISEKNTISTNLSDIEVTERMFSSKNGEKIRALWNGDISAYNSDDSSADMALCMHLAFWTQKNTERIRLLWLSSSLGQRKKTKERKDYQDVTIAHAIAATTDVYTPYAQDEFIKNFNLMVGKKGPYLNAENILRILRKDELLSNSFRYNAFNNSEETNFGSVSEWREIEKRDINFVMLHVQRTYASFEKVTRQIIEEAIIAFCSEKTVNPPKEWIEKLEWDGEHRLDHWLTHTYGAEDNEYHSAVGANWLKGLVKRIINPGCKFDYVIILEGPQGWKKSTSLSVIGRGFHVETVLSPDNKDFFMVMARNYIVEFSEGHTMNRSDTRLLKSIITMTEDQIRVPYGRGISRFPRHCVFAMTTNESFYLRDETGNRRFLPVELKKQADIEWLENNLEQLYAESYHRVILNKETTWEFPEDTAEIQQSRMVENPYTGKLLQWYFSFTETKRTEEGITALEAYQSVWLDNVPLGREMSVVNMMQITGLFSSLLKLKKKESMINGVKAKRWFPTKETDKLNYSVPVLQEQKTINDYEKW